MVAAETPSPWTDAEWAAALISLLGDAVGGVHLRAPPGPVRDYWLERVKQLSEQDPIRKIPANIPEGRLLGGIDLGATLQHGRPIAETGMLGECHGLIVIAAMGSVYLAAQCIICAPHSTTARSAWQETASRP